MPTLQIPAEIFWSRRCTTLLAGACSYQLFPAWKWHNAETFHIVGPAEINPEPGKARRCTVGEESRDVDVDVASRPTYWDHSAVGNAMDITDAYGSRLG